MPVVELRDVSVHYSRRGGVLGVRGVDKTHAVDGVSLTLHRGDSLGLVGESGSGKSTLGRVVVGMLQPTSGTVLVGGRDLWGLDRSARQSCRRTMQVVFQDPYSSLDPRRKVGDSIAEPLTLGVPGRGRRPEIRGRVAELLELVGMSATSASNYPHQFSGGQRQRIAIARALSGDPNLIVLDEPTSALDVSIQAQIVSLLKDIQSKLGVSYLVISHDLAVVAQLVSAVAVLYEGRVVEQGPVATVYRSPRHPYTELLLSSVPGRPTSGRTVDALDVEAERTRSASLTSCVFSPRCALRRQLGEPEVCDAVTPELQDVSPIHWVACHFASAPRL